LQRIIKLSLQATTTTTTTYYNSRGLKENGSKKDLANGFRLWIDMVEPTPDELINLQKEFNLDSHAIDLINQKAKRPQTRILDNYLFTIILDMRYKTLKQLTIEGIYMFVGKDWLITIHSSNIDLISSVKHIFEQKNKKLKESNIDALYYTIISEVIEKYEQLLTSIELTITDFEQKSLYKKPSKSMLSYLETVTKQIIILRRHFWYTRDIMNFLIHTQKDKEEEIKYLRMAYDDINQLIELAESYRDTINSTRELYIANVSLQLSDTMRILTIFSVILLPLTLIAGIYGMNGLDLSHLNNVPTGFITVSLSMGIIVILLLIFFKQKEWILVKEVKDE
jgi:magnesium transporter